MINVSDYFEVVFSKDKLQASLIQIKSIPEDQLALSDMDIINFLHEQGITYGIRKEVITDFIKNGTTLTSELVVAEGDPPIPGEDARLLLVHLQKDKRKKDDTATIVNLRDILDIPSVKQGELVGEKVPATPGKQGMNVFGDVIASKRGKDFILRPGKNTVVSEDGLKLYSQIDGQVSYEQNKINVYPVFEVNGDVDMKVGNISFVGNVIVNGNVLTGFEIKAQGDIRIFGIVEAATLVSDGTIYVSTGIVGQGSGKIYAKQDLYATFVNQANIEAEGDIYISQSILHSNCVAGGSIYCTKGRGNIVGGSCSSGESIIANEIGTSMHTATELYLGVHQKALEKQTSLEQTCQKAREELTKLQRLLEAFEKKETLGPLTAKERIMKLRVRSSIENTEAKLKEAVVELKELLEKLAGKEKGMVKVHKEIFPNVVISFGKYRRKMTKKYQHVKIQLKNSEIDISIL